MKIMVDLRITQVKTNIITGCLGDKLRNKTNTVEFRNFYEIGKMLKFQKPSSQFYCRTQTLFFFYLILEDQFLHSTSKFSTKTTIKHIVQFLNFQNAPQ